MADPLRAMSDAGRLRVAVAEQPPSELLLALGRLDLRLERAAAAARSFGEAGADPYRGLYISGEEVASLLAREPCAPQFETAAPEEHLFESVRQYPSRLAELAEAHGLSCFDLDVAVIALAPELDLRYERVYAFLQDDMTRRRPTVELALNLLCSDTAAKLSRRAHFSSDAPLFRGGLMQVVPDPNQPHPPLPAHYLKLD